MMKRLFRWRDHLVVAYDLDDAWRILEETLLENPDFPSGEDPVLSMMDRKQQEEPVEIPDEYDAVDPREYLHAVPPDDILQFALGELVMSLRVGELRLLEDAAGSGDLIVSRMAHQWAESVPYGYWRWIGG